MKIQWNGTAPTQVRLVPNAPKTEVQPGDVIDVENAEYAKQLLNYHRKTMVEVAEDATADAEVAEPAPAVETKDAPERAKKVVTAKLRKTKAA